MFFQSSEGSGLWTRGNMGVECSCYPGLQARPRDAHLAQVDVNSQLLDSCVLPRQIFVYPGTGLQISWVPVRCCLILTAQVQKDGHAVGRRGG